MIDNFRKSEPSVAGIARSEIMMGEIRDIFNREKHFQTTIKEEPQFQDSILNSEVAKYQSQIIPTTSHHPIRKFSPKKVNHG